jgi:hypothetical protein
MTIRFIPLTKEETLQDYPQYVREDIACFLILKDNQPGGLYGLIDRGVDQETGSRLGEGFLTIFPAFRFQVIGKEFLRCLFDHPFQYGFQKVYTWTRLSSWQKLFGRFKSLGIHRLEMSPPWDTDPTKGWFVKEKKKEF